MLGEWAIFGIFAGVVTTIQLSYSFVIQKKLDKNGNIVIDEDTVPFIKITHDMVVKMEKPGYAELSILNLWRCLVEAMLHAFCYGCLIVFSMNYMIDFIMLRDRRYAYLVTCLMIHMACMFMCTFATNAIHLATSHSIHFFYYGFGYIALVFFSRRPEHEYMVVIAAISLLAIYIVGRFISHPGYPGVPALFRLYKYSILVDDNTTGDFNTSRGDWKIKSMPATIKKLSIRNLKLKSARNSNARNDEDDEESTECFIDDQIKEIEKIEEIKAMPSPKEFHQWAFTCPVYEIMNGNISSSFTIGVLSGTVTSLSLGHSNIFNAGVVSNESLGFSVLIAALVVMIIQGNGLYGSVENEMHSRSLGRFWPKTVAVSVGIMGAAAVVIHLEPIGDDHPDTPYWVGFGVLVVNLLLTFALSVWAKLRHQKIHKKDVIKREVSERALEMSNIREDTNSFEDNVACTSSA